MSEPIHVLPLNDLREHIESADCWCKPMLEEFGTMLVHNSMDRREEYENGRKMS